MKNSHIQWCDHTFNPWIGCTIKSPGCFNCYAWAMNRRFADGVNWGKGAPRRRTSPHYWNDPRRWDKLQQIEEADARVVGRVARPRPRVFCASLADWLDDEVPIEWLADLLQLIHETPNLDWLLLTKRPENWRERILRALAHVEGIDYGCADAWEGDAQTTLGIWLNDWTATDGTGIPDNVWIGTTVEDQARADERIPLLLQIPAKIRFLSCEPLLGPVDISAHRPRISKTLDSQLLLPDWVICGGESGPGARPFFVEWAWDIFLQCRRAGVPFFMKQLGAHVRTSNANALDWPEHVTFTEVENDPAFAAARVGLTDKKGGDMADFPEELRVREFPK